MLKTEKAVASCQAPDSRLQSCSFISHDNKSASLITIAFHNSQILADQCTGVDVG